MSEVFCRVPNGRRGWPLLLKRAACGGLLGLCLAQVSVTALAEPAPAQLPDQLHKNIFSVFIAIRS